MRDWDIRLALCDQLRSEHAGQDDTLLIEEMGVCQGSARIDVAVLNGVISGFEIKSPSDTLLRLPNQRDAYNRVFDFVTIVTSAKYLEIIDRVVPSWWGLKQAALNADGTVLLTNERAAQRNEDLDPYALAELLWKEEVLEILEFYGASKGVKSKPRRFAWERLVDVVPMPELAEVVRVQVKKRVLWQQHLLPVQLTGQALA